jgi:hypothetical protein
MNETDSAVCRALDANLPAMGEMLTTFVAMPTENPPATDYAAFVTVLQSALDRLGMVHERVDVQTTDGCPRPAVFAWLGDAAQRCISTAITTSSLPLSRRNSFLASRAAYCSGAAVRT